MKKGQNIFLRTRGRISSQNWSNEAPVRQGATTKDWQRQFEEEQRRRTGWIDVPKWEVIFPWVLKAQILRTVRHSFNGFVRPSRTRCLPLKNFYSEERDASEKRCFEYLILFRRDCPIFRLRPKNVICRPAKNISAIDIRPRTLFTVSTVENNLD